MKICTKCKVEKPFSEFHKQKGRKDGYRSQCKECRKIYDIPHRINQKENKSIYDSIYYQEHKESKKEYARNHYKENPEYYYNYGLEYNHIRRALINNATIGEVSSRREIYERDKGICGICKELVQYEDYELDHIIPLFKGGLHDDSNFQVSHMLCNRSKGNKIL